MRILVLIFASLLTTTVFAQHPLDTLSLKRIFMEPYLPGVRPDIVNFTPDDRYVLFNWNEEGMASTSLYQVDLKGKTVEKAPDDVQRYYTLSPEGKHIIFQKRGDLYIADSDLRNERVLVASKSFDYDPTFSADGSQLAYAANGDVWITGVNSGLNRQVTQKKEEEPSFSVEGWSGDSTMVVAQTDNSDYKEYYFPEYAGALVRTGSTRRGIPTRILSSVDIKTAKMNELFNRKGWTSSGMSATGRYLFTDWTDEAMKKREITIYDLQVDTSYTVFEDSTEGWIFGRNAGFAPEGDRFMFQSEQDGWNHVYSADPDGSDLRQHTSGEYDIPWAQWLDENTMVIATSKRDPGDIQLYRLDLRTGKMTALTSTDGHRRDFRMSNDLRYVVYAKTSFNKPADLYLTDIRKPGNEVRLTNSIPDGFSEMDWQQEDYLRFKGRDGETMLSASILKPDTVDQVNGNPVVVFVHGAGSLQNVFKGWSFSYWREYLFHQYLARQGYYVLEVDYRHSTGYGRKFREDVTGWMGKYETEDIEDGLALLADRYPQADTSRVGIYGGSYGGFMALYAVSVSPDKFDAAAALRAVTNWENYFNTNPWYTHPRLGTPEADSANYARSSPLTYADSLQQPVLILHGLIDNNVGFQDAAQYVEKLIQSGNEDFEMMMYPTERHSFRDPDAWYDEYRRIWEFFERKLR